MFSIVTNWRYETTTAMVSGALQVGTSTTNTDDLALTSDFIAFQTGDLATRVEVDLFTSALQFVSSTVRGSRVFIGIVHKSWPGYMSKLILAYFPSLFYNPNLLAQWMWKISEN